MRSVSGDAAYTRSNGALNTFVAVTVWGDRDLEVSGRRHQDVHLLLAVGGMPGVIGG
jgi:hypothetical protein